MLRRIRSRIARFALMGGLLVLGGSTGLSPAMAADSLPGSGITVRPARGTWDTGWFQTEVYVRALETLGYTVDRPKTLTNPVFFTALGNGDLDFWVNGWFPVFDRYFNEVADSATKVGYVARGGALSGYLIDKRTSDRYGITNLGQLTDPALAALFDGNDDGKADLVACPPGWSCEFVIRHHLEAYGLTDTVKATQADYAAAMANAIAHYENGGSILFYTWTPNWTVGVLKPGTDVVWIEVPFPSLPPDQQPYIDQTTLPEVAGCVDNPCELGWLANDLRPVANTAFLEANPAARRLFEVAGIPLADISAQNARMFRGEDSPEDIIRHAEEGIAAHQARFDGWIAEAKAAATAP